MTIDNPNFIDNIDGNSMTRALKNVLGVEAVKKSIITNQLGLIDEARIAKDTSTIF